MASMTNQVASSSSSSFPNSGSDEQKYSYDVFLSFRGQDTRYNFTDHLYNALRQRGINTFVDDKLTTGEDISAALLKAIEESRVSIIVFSQNYASSRWCLDELVKILECRKSKGQRVWTIFYKVDPSDVRHQRGTFGGQFAKLERRYKGSMDRWRAALSEAANLSGWPFSDGEYESQFIKKIVEDLSTQVLFRSYNLEVAKYPIGIESCIQDIDKLLDMAKSNVLILGIWGPGGIGKTTIAKAVLNSIGHKFEGSCFLADVRSNSMLHRGLAQLQEILLFDMLGDSNLKVTNVHAGVSLIKKRLQHKKLLLILDDVTDSEQLDNLAPQSQCFGPGSRIIITTRDKHWLTAHQVDTIYEVKMLDDGQALELFSLNAFNSKGPPGDYMKYAQRAVCYAQGLPLALIVLGCHLAGRSIDQWEVALDTYTRAPHKKIQEILKLSFDCLEDAVKEFFLDIACFFNGKHVDHVTPILEACYDVNPAFGIAVLQEKALIRIDVDKIWMHDLIEEMGKEIVHQESPDEPGKRSRLWIDRDVKDVLTKNKGTNKIKGIQVRWGEHKISLNAKSFLELKSLRYISMSRNFECFSGDIDYLSNKLRWLHWPECPLQSFPSDFHPKKLVTLNIGSRCITRLWEGLKYFPFLTSMKLYGCHLLKEFPNLIGIPNLKELILSGCESLVEVHHSVGSLDKLITLYIGDCSNLVTLPKEISLKSVHSIRLIDCKKIEKFPEIIGKMDFLIELDLSGSGIKQLHPSIGNLFGLEHLRLNRCQNLAELDPSIGNLIGLKTLSIHHCENLTTLPSSISGLQDLEILSVSRCSKLAAFPIIIGKMNFLRELDLSNSGIIELNPSIGNLIGLQALFVQNCVNLTTVSCSIYELQNLEIFFLSGCSKLVTFPTNTNSLQDGKISDDNGGSLSLPKLQVLLIGECNLSDCHFLTTLDCRETLRILDMSVNNFVSLPACISKFVNLEKLTLHSCKRLQEILELPPSLVKLDMSDCESMERFSKLSKVLEHKESHRISWINLWNCYRLCDNLSFEKMESILLNNQMNYPFSVVFPKSTAEVQVPKWFCCWSDVIGNENDPCNLCKFSIRIYKNLDWEKTGLAICAVSEEGRSFYCGVEIFINDVCIRHYDGSSWTSSSASSISIRSKSDHVWVEYLPLPVERKAHVEQKDSFLPYYECRVVFYHPIAKHKSKSCGVHLVSSDEYSNKVKVVEQSNKKRHCVVDHADLLESANHQQKRHRRANSL